jgi:hypothetical protein
MLGKRYGLLPSEVLLRATTFDLEVLDVSLTYEAYKTNKANGVQPEVGEDAMLQALQQVKGANNGNNN